MLPRVIYGALCVLAALLLTNLLFSIVLISPFWQVLLIALTIVAIVSLTPRVRRRF